MTNKRLKLFALTGWCLAVVGLLGLFLALWGESKRSTYVASLDGVAEKLAPKINESVKDGGVYVVPFSDYSGRTPQVGLFLADYLAGSLQRRAKRFHILDRDNLTNILDEHKLAASGLVDPQTSVRLGDFEAASMLLVGNIDLHQRQIVLNVRVVDVRTARSIAIASSTMVATEQMEQLWRKSLTAGSLGPAAQEIRRQQQWAGRDPEREAFKSVAVDFFVKNWPWLWTVLLVPIFTWLLGKLRRKKEEPKADGVTKSQAA